jgi:hypothetical protein
MGMYLAGTGEFWAISFSPGPSYFSHLLIIFIFLIYPLIGLVAAKARYIDY